MHTHIITDHACARMRLSGRTHQLEAGLEIPVDNQVDIVLLILVFLVAGLRMCVF